MARRKLDFHWNLRRVMAAHRMWKTTDLIPLLGERGVELSASQAPPAILADALGVSAGTAMRHAFLGGADWSVYAARRHAHTPGETSQ
jgi:hypothetical protein